MMMRLLAGDSRSRAATVRRGRGPGVRAYALLTPFVGLCGLLLATPVAIALYLSFTNIQLIGPDATTFSFTGLANIERLVADPLFVHSLLVTLVFALVGTAVIQTFVGTAVAFLLSHVSSWIRTVTIGVTVVAWVIPEVVVGLAWYGMAQPGGVIDGVSRAGDSDLLLQHALVIVIAANIWHNLAFTILMLSAGLRSIPTDAVEAAAVDGAGAWRTLWEIKLPLLRATLAANVTLSVLQSLSVFTLIYVMTQGGPANATLTVPIYLYQQGFNNNTLGYATLMAIVLLAIGAVLAGLMVRQVGSGRRLAKA
ncbi:MAG: sugar ABC transporter permease [Acidimicrobiales bacterium]|jgi:multiple sugar transport system permease protein